MDTHAQWPQDIGMVKPIEEMVSNTCTSNPNNNNNLSESRRTRPHKEQAINCPRCNSTNTKFCYYNNYSLTQPRYFCKTCRRYWTEGGSLRNVPVGGGSRKNRRSSSSSSSSSVSATSKIKLPDSIKSSSHQNPKIHESHDLNLAFPNTDHYHSISEFAELSNMDQNNNNNNSHHHHHHIPTSSTSLSSLEFLRSGISSRGLNSFMPMPVLHDQDSTTVYTSAGFALTQDFKPTLSFGVDGLGGGGGSSYGNIHHQGQETTNSGRPLFPFEDLRQVSSPSEFDNHHQTRGHQGDSNGYWSGMLGGGSW